MAWALVQAAQVKGIQNREAIIVMIDITATHRQGPRTGIRTEGRAADIRNLDLVTGMGMTGGTGTEDMVIGQPAGMEVADLRTAASIQDREVDMGDGRGGGYGGRRGGFEGGVVGVAGAVRGPDRLLTSIMLHAKP